MATRTPRGLRAVTRRDPLGGAPPDLDPWHRDLVRLLPYDVAAMLAARCRDPETDGAVVRALEGIDLPRLDAVCSFRVAYQEAVICGRGVTTYEPAGGAAREVRRMFTELFGAPARARRRPARATQTVAADSSPHASTRARGAAS